MEKGYTVPIDKIVRSQVSSKMSKSRGNVVSVDEIVHWVRSLADGFEFRDRQDQLIDWKHRRVWFLDKQGYFVDKREPVFLHRVGDPVPMLLSGWSTVQHPNALDYWLALLEKYEN